MVIEAPTESPPLPTRSPPPPTESPPLPAPISYVPAPLNLPPLPPLALGETIVRVPATVITLEFVLGGDINDFGDEWRAALSTALCAQLECYEPSCLLDLVVAPASVNVQARLSIPINQALIGGSTTTGVTPGTTSSPLPSVVHTVTANANTLAAMPATFLSTSLDVLVESAPTVVVEMDVSVPLVFGPPPPMPSPPPPTPPPPSLSHSPSSTRTVLSVALMVVIALIIVVLLVALYRLRAQRNQPTFHIQGRFMSKDPTTQMSVFHRSSQQPTFTVAPSFSQLGASGLPSRKDHGHNDLPSEMSPVHGTMGATEFTVV